MPETPPPLPQQPAKKRGCLRAFLIVVGAFFAVIVIIAIVGALIGPSRSQSSSPSSGPSSAPSAQEAPISWSEVDSIYNLRSNNTDLQRKEKWKQFKGKRVRWTGTVTSVSDGWGGLTLQVKMNADTFTSDVLIRLESSEKSKALQLHEGEPVTFTGNLDDWGTLLPITIGHGEIIER